MPGLFAAVYAQWAGPVGDAFVRAKQLVDWAVRGVSSSRLSGARSRQVCQISTTSAAAAHFVFSLMRVRRRSATPKTLTAGGWRCGNCELFPESAKIDGTTNEPGGDA